MELMDVIKRRRSIRNYDPGNIPKEKLDRVLMAGLLSPSGRNIKPWEFIVVEDRSALANLAEARTGNADMLKQASCAIVVVGNQELTDTWVEDCSLAMLNMHMMADYLGLGSCWIQCRMRYAKDGRTSEEYIREMLKIPENYRLEAILSLGLISSHPRPHTEAHARVDKIHRETF
ncbi:MAG: nitroreductase family protein [Lachnospiraceae bacterium]|nr:nitroreductase family protein [Lachnospiraceae bacterium]